MDGDGRSVRGRRIDAVVLQRGGVLDGVLLLLLVVAGGGGGGGGG
jgi:hypothetical protein